MKAKWNVNNAMELWFSGDYSSRAQGQPQAAAAAVSENTIKQLFDKFKEDENNIYDDGISAFFGELGVNAESDIVALLISMYMKAQNMG